MALEQTAASKIMQKKNSSVTAASSSRARRGRSRRLDANNSSSFTSYLVFGMHVTCCLCLFLVLYVLVLASLFPLLDEEPLSEIPTHRGQALRPVVERVQKRLHASHLAESVVGKLRQQFDALRKAEDLTNTRLVDQALEEFEEWRKQQHREPPPQLRSVVVQKIIQQQPPKKFANVVEQAAQLAPQPKAQIAAPPPTQRGGFSVLGMHRSGTSLLSGLLVQGCGYKVGGPLIGGAADNEKGFFELVDAVLQNDEFMGMQNVNWASNVGAYDSEVALQALKDGKLTFKHGTKALKVLNNPEKVPWLQKDPRMCITLKTWLPLLNTEPAVVFTYRHPLEVAFSLKKRESDFPLERGLRLWIMYNMRAVQNSVNLCRVFSSNEAILADPLNEVQRISDELTNKCQVAAAPRRILKDDVDRFVDPSLQHNKKRREEEDAQKAVIEQYGDCKVHEYVSDYTAGSTNEARERGLYLKAMKLYCDFQSGDAYKEGYEFPTL